MHTKLIKVFGVVLSVVACNSAHALNKDAKYYQIDVSRGAPNTLANSSKNVHIRLDRNGCLGPCPIYSIDIYGDGRVVYVGIDHVVARGKRFKRISQKTVQGLVARFEKARFFQLNDTYYLDGSEGATNSVYFSYRGDAKRVDEQDGLSVGMPSDVEDLEREIEYHAGVSFWVCGRVRC